MQETLERDLEDEREVSIWNTKVEEQVDTEAIKIGNVVEREQDLFLLQEKVQILKI